MHDDGNIRYANYQNESQMRDYFLTTNGLMILFLILSPNNSQGI